MWRHGAIVSRKMADRLPNDQSHRFEALTHISKTFHEAYTIFLSGQRIGSHIGSASWSIQYILWFISSFKRPDVGEILVGFQGRWTSIAKYLLLFWFTDFWRSSRYFSSIVISISFYHVECGDGRQFLNSEVQNTYVFHSRVSHRAVLLLFFALVRAFAFFLFKAKTTLLVLWIFTSNISPHFAEFAGMKLKIISAR